MWRCPSVTTTGLWGWILLIPARYLSDPASSVPTKSPYPLCVDSWNVLFLFLGRILLCMPQPCLCLPIFPFSKASGQISSLQKEHAWSPR